MMKKKKMRILNNYLNKLSLKKGKEEKERKNHLMILKEVIYKFSLFKYLALNDINITKKEKNKKNLRSKPSKNDDEE